MSFDDIRDLKRRWSELDTELKLLEERVLQLRLSRMSLAQQIQKAMWEFVKEV